MTTRPFSDEALARYLVMFEVGEPLRVEAADATTGNRSWRVVVDAWGDEEAYLLTVMDELGFDDMAFYNNLLAHLHQYGLPVASPRRTLDGMTNTVFSGRPSFLVREQAGNRVDVITAAHCEAVGKALGEMHEAVGSLRDARATTFDDNWLASMLDALDDADRAWAEGEGGAKHALASATPDLPRGITHGSLHPGNVLFEGTTVAALLDFYRAGEDVLVQDLATALLTWCTGDGGLNPQLAAAMQSGYESERPLTEDERAALPSLLRRAALRSWLQGHADRRVFDHLPAA